MQRVLYSCAARAEQDRRPLLFRVRDCGDGKLAFCDAHKAEVAPSAPAKKKSANNGFRFKRRLLRDSAGVFLVDTGFSVFVLVGSGAAAAGLSSKARGPMAGHAYLNDKKRPCFLPIVKVAHGREPEGFARLFYVSKEKEGGRCMLQ